MKKQCTQCGERKEMTAEFWHKGKALGGFTSKCKQCRHINDKVYRDSNKGKSVRSERENKNKKYLQEYQKEYKIKNKDSLKEKRKIYYNNNIEKIREYRKTNANIISYKQKERYNKKQYSELHHKTNKYINKLGIKKDICFICGSKDRIVAHHPDYNKWNEIVFCCYSCHQLIHSGYLKCPEPIDLLNNTTIDPSSFVIRR